MGKPLSGLQNPLDIMPSDHNHQHQNHGDAGEGPDLLGFLGQGFSQKGLKKIKHQMAAVQGGYRKQIDQAKADG
jgi:hypothetical protein